MKCIEIGVIDPKDEHRAMLDWAARVDTGEKVADADSRLSFATYSQLHAALTDKSMELLEHVALREGRNIRQLAAELERDYKNVYDDAQMLSALGLIEKRDNGLFAPYDEINIHKMLRRAA